MADHVGGQDGGEAALHVLSPVSKNTKVKAQRLFGNTERECPLLCRFLGRRFTAFEFGGTLAGVREAPRHEIAGAVRGWFR
jgi:hypothetical protein